MSRSRVATLLSCSSMFVTMVVCGNSDSGSSNDSSVKGAASNSATRPQLDDATAADYTVKRYLASAGVLTSGLSTDNWDPTAGVGDVNSFAPTFTVAADGSGTHRTVQSAMDAALAAGGGARVYVRVKPGRYNEVVCVQNGTPPVTLFSIDSNAATTVIVAGHANGEPKAAGSSANPCNPNASSNTLGTSGSATFAVYADGFQAKNLTIENNYDEGAYPSGNQAVALMTQADKLIFENIRALGHQDTLYVKTPNVDTVARAYFKNSAIQGDVDFIFGRGTFVLDGCTITYLTDRQGLTGGYIVAPSTDPRNNYGILIINSTLNYAGSFVPKNSINLGRAWDEGVGSLSNYVNGVSPNGQVVIRNCELGSHINLTAPWSSSTVSRPFSSTTGPYSANRFYEHANTGPGSGR